MSYSIQDLMGKYEESFKKGNYFIYKGQEYEDSLLLKWWIHLQESKDIERLIKPASRPLNPFFSIFRFPTVFVYSLDSNNEIDNAGWVTPEDEKSEEKTAFSGLWTKENLRGSLRQYKFIRTYYSLLFEFFHAILGLTWQPDLLELHKKLGYNIVGCIPNYYSQPYCYIVHLTKENFFSSQFYKAGGSK